MLKVLSSTRALLLSSLLLGSSCITPSVFAAGSGAYHSNSSTSAEKFYNQGVTLMMDKKFSKAEKKFRSAIKKDSKLAEAHNNLAYTLRKQGTKNYEAALTHYNKAIYLDQKLPEPYMYRGVLYVQMGNKQRALEDHQTLLDMKSPLAAELEYVVKNGREKTPEQFFGVSNKL
ncbi:tetratricopeptide repeat protein [Vibrio comitans]|nr:tetratricopeptide repeat protein [Vibrio comitans]